MAIYRNTRNFLLILSVITGLYACDPWFAFSPYEANLETGYHGTTEKHLGLINARDAGDSKPFKIALVSDPHYHFSKLDDALLHINQQNDYDFAIVAGDLTENGLMQEYIFFYESMDRLNIPYLTVIGNHDYLSNGEKVYSQMYGPYNYTFVYNNVKFVMFDNNTIESEKSPDMEWLARELVNDHGYDHVIPFAHIPPYDTQMKDHVDAFHALMVENNIRVSVHGHKHDFSIEEAYGDGVRYATVSSPQKRTYSELIFTPGTIDIRKIEY